MKDNILYFKGSRCSGEVKETKVNKLPEELKLRVVKHVNKVEQREERKKHFEKEAAKPLKQRPFKNLDEIVITTDIAAQREETMCCEKCNYKTCYHKSKEFKKRMEKAKKRYYKHPSVKAEKHKIRVYDGDSNHHRVKAQKRIIRYYDGDNNTKT